MKVRDVLVSYQILSTGCVVKKMSQYKRKWYLSHRIFAVSNVINMRHIRFYDMATNDVI